MNTPKKNDNAAVDNILEELKGRGGAPAPSGGSVDDILAEMGMGEKKLPLPKTAPKPAAPAAEKAPAAPKAPEAPPAAPGGTAVFEPVKEAAQKPDAGQTAVFTPPGRQAAPAGRDDAGTTRTLPAFDIGEESEPAGPRLGKAAAIDRVDHDKFSGDEELLSWFSPEADSKFSRRAMRKEEKERKKQEAADERERRRREKRGGSEPEEDPFADYPIEPLVREKPARQAVPAEEAAPVAEERPEPRPPQEAAPPPVQQAVPEPPAPKAPVAPAAPAAAAPKAAAPLAGRTKGPVTEILEGLGVETEAGPVIKPPVASVPPAEKATPNWKPVHPAPKAPPAEAAAPKPAPPAQETPVSAAPAPIRKKGPVTAVLEELGVEKGAGPVVKPPIASSAPAAPKTADLPAAFQTGRKKGPVTEVLEGLGLEGDRGTAASSAPKVPKAPAEKPAAKPLMSSSVDESDYEPLEGSTIEITIAKVAEARRQAAVAAPRAEREDTQTFETEGHEGGRIPSAAYTQEFPEAEEVPQPKAEGGKNLFLDDMVDDRFRDFFSETVIVEREELEQSRGVSKIRRKPKKSHTALITGEFARLAEQAEEEESEEFEDYDRPQDAEAIEKDIITLRGNLTRRTIFTAVLAGLLVWLGLGFSGLYDLPAFILPDANPLLFSIFYLAFLVVAVVLNFTTVATGLVGLVGEPTVDSPPALAAVAALLQGVVMVVQLVTGEPAVGTLFAGLAVLVLAFNCLGKRLRATAILENFRVATAGFEHSAAYVLDGGHEVAYNITGGLAEENPSILISRPTALVKGFLRQSFSQRWSDRLGRILAWVILAVSVGVGIFCYVQTKDLMQAISALAATFCIAAPFSSTLLSAVPSRLLQAGTTKVGAVVPGWSAIQELGGVNVVMAGAQDIFPPGSVHLRGIKTFEKERVDLAILYAASVLVESCPTLREVFLAVIQGKSEMLFKVENLLEEPGRGSSAWVENNRVVIGTREMLQKHGIDPPPVELEIKSVQDGNLPVYLAVSGKLYAMFIVGYTPDMEVQDTLDGLIKSGVSLLVKSEDMNVTGELIERVYQLQGGVVKVLGKRELDLLEPLEAYLPESEGAMTHMGSFASFIGGMRAAAGCAAAERMSGIVQAASVALACVLAVLLAYSGGLATLAIGIAILYQLGWSVLVSALPFARRY